MITGISGGDSGVQGFVAAADINSGKKVWKAYSVGPDSDLMLI